jgi:hypothetical protein
MSIAIHLFMICVQINHFYDCHFNLVLWHMVKITYNCKFYFKVVLNCKWDYNLLLLLVLTKMKMKTFKEYIANKEDYWTYIQKE